MKSEGGKVKWKIQKPFQPTVKRKLIKILFFLIYSIFYINTFSLLLALWLFRTKVISHYKVTTILALKHKYFTLGSPAVFPPAVTGDCAHEIISYHFQGFILVFVSSSPPLTCPRRSTRRPADCVSGAVLPSEVHSTQRPQGENAHCVAALGLPPRSQNFHTSGENWYKHLFFSFFWKIKYNLKMYTHTHTHFRSSSRCGTQETLLFSDS